MIRIITVAQKCPRWLDMAFHDYVKRFPAHCRLQLIEIPLEKRVSQQALARLIEKEGERVLAFLKPQHHVIALDVQGALWSTHTLALKIQDWQMHGLPVDFLIGGPDGLANACLQRANEKWSLSPLTFPHHLVRLLLAEQLYRAHTMLTNHPYHRA